MPWINKQIINTGGGGWGSVSSVFSRTWAVTAQSWDYTASQITNVPSGSLASTNLQSALNELSTTVDLKQYKTSVTVSRSTGSDYVCDGTADHVQIDAAIAAVYAAWWGIVYIKEWTYDVSGRMTKKSNVILLGDGMWATNLIGWVVGDWMFYNTSAVSRFAISDMTLDCNNTTTGGLLGLNKATECSVSQVEFKNVASGGWHVALGADNTLDPIDCFDNVFKDCIFDTHAGTLEMLLLMNAENTKVINCKFKNKTTTWPVLWVYQQCENTKIIHCTWEDNVWFAGYYSLSCNNTTIFDCDIKNTWWFQWANLADNWDFGYTQVYNVSFLYNRFEWGANTDAYDYNAIEMWATDNAKIIWNTISGYNIPIVCHDGNTAVPALSTNFVIENNTFFNNTISNTAFIINPCILFSAIWGSCYWTIKNNKCYDTQGTPTQKYPITFSGAYTWDKIEITWNRLSAYGWGTSVALANSAAIGSNVTIYANTDYSGTNPAQTWEYKASQVTNTPAWNIAATTVQAALNELDTEKLAKNTAITWATKTKITYDANGLVTAWVDATTADIADSTNKRYATDAEKTKLGFISVTQAVDLDQIESDTATNNAKVSNATHTGDVTGATVLTIDPTAITGKTAVTAVWADYVLISDTSDSGNLKKALVSDFGGWGSGTPWGADTQVQFNDGGAFGGDSRFYFDKSTWGATWGDFWVAAWTSTDGYWGELYAEWWRAWRWGWVQAFAGNAIWADADGGDLYFSSGSGNWTWIGWRVYFQGWWAWVWWVGWDIEFQIWNADTPWKYLFRTASTSFAWELNFESLTADRVATLQDASWTIAYLSDIPAWVLKLPTYTVGAATADYPWFTDTAIQAALDAGNGKIYLTDGTYVLSTGLKFKSNYQYIVGNGEKCIIQFNGATVPTAISPNATNLKQGGIKGVSIQQTNATVQGTALDMSNIALSKIEDVQIKDAGLAIKLNDTANNTFYNDFIRVMAFGCTRWVEFNGTNVSNENRFYSCRFANKSGGDYGCYLAKGQGNKFYACDFEPAATTGNTGVYLTSANCYSNKFDWCWIEGNNVWVLIDSTVTYNCFDWCTITNNTTNFTNNGKNTEIRSQVGSTLTTLINPGSVVDNGNASSVTWNIKNNTTFAHVASQLVKYELLNATDTSDILQINNAWNGAMVNLTSTQGTLQASPIKWDIETDTTGKLYYTHNNSERWVVDAEQYISLTGTYTLTSQTAAQKLFNTSTNWALTVKGATTYMFECFYSLSSMSATSGSFWFAIGGTATLTSIGWDSFAVKWVLTAVAWQSTYNTTAANTTLATAGTATTGYAKIKWIIRINAGGTIIPQVSLGVAAAAIVGANSYFRIWAIWTNTDTRVGNWS